MTELKSGPPPIPPRTDLGEIEEHELDPSVLPEVNINDPVVANSPLAAIAKKEEPVVNPQSSNTLPTPCVAPKRNVGKMTKQTASKGRPAGRPTISIISARPMDQTTSLSAHFMNNNSDSNAPVSNMNSRFPNPSSDAVSVPSTTPASVKPSKPAPPPPEKPYIKTDKNVKFTEISKEKTRNDSQKSKTKASKKDSSSVFYVASAADNKINTRDRSSDNSRTPKLNKTAPKSNTKLKPNFLAPKKTKTRDEVKATETNPNLNIKTEPPEREPSKPGKLKPTIITSKKPKEIVDTSADTAGSMNTKEKSSVERTNATKSPIEQNPPSRPSFPPSADVEMIQENDTNPKRPVAPPNAVINMNEKRVEKNVQRKCSSNEQSGKKQAKVKPPRPPMSKGRNKLKPSRPAPGKPDVASKLSPEASDVSTADDKPVEKNYVGKATHQPHAMAKFEYSGETQDDLPFKMGDKIMLTSKVDDDWFVGYLENDVMRQGLFPSSFVDVIIPLKEQPNINKSLGQSTSEPHAIALHNFQGQGEGELTFSSGELIILLERINDEWLKGKLNNCVGIFPVSFVRVEIDLPFSNGTSQVVVPSTEPVIEGDVDEEWCQAIHDFQGEHEDDLNFFAGAKIKILEKLSQEWFKGEYSGKSGLFPAGFVEIIKGSTTFSKDSHVFVALHDYPGESADDLSFRAGDKIKIIEQINADWFRGECEGQQGLFPASFVDMSSSSEFTTQTEVEDKKNVRLAKVIHEFTGENSGELHLNVGDNIHVLREVDGNWSEGMINGVYGIFPTAFVEMEPGFKSEDQVLAKALYDFAGESEQDLTFKTGDIIQLLERIDENWSIGSVRGKTGHFPSTFVEILASS